MKVHVIASGCVWVSVCAHTSRCNMELLLATKEHFDCQFFLVLKKKRKKKITLFHWGSSAPLPRLPPISYLGLIHLCTSATNIIVSIQLLLCAVVNRGGLVREPEVEQGLAPSRLWYRTSVQTPLAGRKSPNKKLEQIQHSKTSWLFVPPVWCSAQQRASWSSQ